MKILQILPQLNYGGVEVGTVDLAQALIERGHSAYVISAGGELVPKLLKMGAQHYELPVHKKSIQAITTIAKVREIIERERIDIVHARSRVPAWIAYCATRRTNAKFVTTCHGYYSKHLMSTIMGWGERVIVISRAVGRRMIDDFSVLPERIRLIHRGLDASRYFYDKDRYSSQRQQEKERFIVANIGRLTPIKGHEYFIRAIHLLARQYPHIEAWIVGGGAKRKAKYVEELKVLVDKLGVKNQIKFMGVEENVPELLKKVDLLVLSTTYPEGFGRVIIEAGASGVAVVATKVGGVPDIIDDGKHGLLVPPQDEYKMSEAILTLMQNPSLARTLSMNLRKKVETDFSIDGMIDKTIAVYEEVRSMRRILVIKLGALGDIILAVPSLRMLRKKYPKAFIAVLVDANLTSTLENCPYVDEIIPFKRKERKNRMRNLRALIRRLRKFSFDISVDFQNTPKTHAIAFLSGVTSRYGYKRGILGRLLTHGVGSFEDPLPPVQHQFRVLNLLGITECDERLELWPQNDDVQFIRHFFQQDWISPEQKKVGLVLGASKRWQSKKWPLDYFVKLSERLREEYNAVVVLIGDETNKTDRDLFLTKNTKKVIDLVGNTTMSQLSALMGELDCVVSSDTAPLHVASAMNTKTVCLFGPTDPRRHVPPGGSHIVLRRNLSCSPCYKERCVEGHRCMREISVDEVFAAVTKQLGTVSEKKNEKAAR
jgi:lipopolysaccharide heptosyltransferase II